MPEFDEALLDDADACRARDRSGLLWALATAGAQVRRAGETAAEFDVERLRADDPPRAVLVATDVPVLGPLLTRLGAASAPVLTWRGADLPRWVGPADALLVGAVEGHDPRLASLTAEGARRGPAMVVVAPTGSPVAAAAGRAPVGQLTRGLHPRAARWAVLTPLLQALEVLRVHPVPRETLAETADALDEQAAACRPDAELFVNPAKALAAELAGSLPVIAGAGPLAGVAARVFAGALQLFAASPAVPAPLPEAVGRAAALLAGARGTSAEQDLFRDRVDDAPATRPRLIVLGDDGAPDDPLLGDRSAAELRFDEVAARDAARTLRRVADDLGLRTSGVDVPAGAGLARFAAATAFGDFVAAYLALGLGRDPGAAGPADHHADQAGDSFR